MRNIFLITKREYLERVRSRAFLIMTIFIPALMFAMTAGPALLATRVSGGPRHLVVAVTDRQTGDLIREELEKQQIDPANSLDRKAQSQRFQVEVDTNASDSERAALVEKVNALFKVTPRDDRLYVLTNDKAPRFKLMAVDLHKWDRNFGELQAQVEQAKVAPAGRHVSDGHSTLARRGKPMARSRKPAATASRTRRPGARPGTR